MYVYVPVYRLVGRQEEVAQDIPVGEGLGTLVDLGEGLGTLVGLGAGLGTLVEVGIPVEVGLGIQDR